MPNLILLIQCFQPNFIHSQQLYRNAITKLFSMSNSFAKLELHEFTIVLKAICGFWNKTTSPEIEKVIRDRCNTIITDGDEAALKKYGHHNYYHQIEKIYWSLVQLQCDDDAPLKEKCA